MATTDDEPNVGVLLFVSYRAMESRVLEAVADGRLRRHHPGAGV